VLSPIRGGAQQLTFLEKNPSGWNILPLPPV
jgi:hypothetical protein